MNKYTCYSGGAEGADTVFEMCSALKDFNVVAFSFKGHHTTSIFRKNLTKAELQEGWEHILVAVKTLKRYVTEVSDYTQKLLSRDYFQAKNADAIFAVSRIVNPGELGSQFLNKASVQVIDGGTGYAVQCGIDMEKPVFVFNMTDNNWYKWNYGDKIFEKCQLPKLTEKFAGIGSRKLTPEGNLAIRSLFTNI